MPNAPRRQSMARDTGYAQENGGHEVRARWYVGHVKDSTKREAFKSESEPTNETHGIKYTCVWGPFRTKRGAAFGASWRAVNNPHVQSVADAERIAKHLANGTGIYAERRE